MPFVAGWHCQAPYDCKYYNALGEQVSILICQNRIHIGAGLKHREGSFPSSSPLASGNFMQASRDKMLSVIFCKDYGTWMRPNGIIISKKVLYSGDCGMLLHSLVRFNLQVPLEEVEGGEDIYIRN